MKRDIDHRDGKGLGEAILVVSRVEAVDHTRDRHIVVNEVLKHHEAGPQRRGWRRRVERWWLRHHWRQWEEWRRWWFTWRRQQLDAAADWSLGLREGQPQLQTEQLKQLADRRRDHRQQSSAFAMDVHVDAALGIRDEHVAVCDAVQPVSKVVDHKHSHPVELGSSERRRLQYPFAQALALAHCPSRYLEAHVLRCTSAGAVWGARRRRRGRGWRWRGWEYWRWCDWWFGRR